VSSSLPAARAVGDAIQNLMAVRLARGFVPLGALFALGIGLWLLGGPGGQAVAFGAILAAGAMLAYGLRIVQRALGRPRRFWMSLAMGASVVPPAYALYVLGWRGLRGLAVSQTTWALALATIHFALGVWVLRVWMRVVEIERLAKIMNMNANEDGGSPG
jgi:hypothetical protein